MKFTKHQRAILVGTILGDAYLQKTGERNARLRLEHGIKQKDYLLWKVSAFEKLFQGSPVFMSRVHPKTKKTYEYWRFQSNACPELGELRAVFYGGGKKTIPEDLEKYLNEPLSLAVWYMDDGYYYQRDNVAYLYLGRVFEREAEICKNVLAQNFGLETKILNKKQKGYALYFSSQQVQKLKEIIGRYLIPSMIYKIPS